jgi:hypothetical protein
MYYYTKIHNRTLSGISVASTSTFRNVPFVGIIHGSKLKGTEVEWLPVG